MYDDAIRLLLTKSTISQHDYHYKVMHDLLKMI